MFRIILEHPLASDLQHGVDIQDRNGHVIHQHLSFFNSTVPSTQVITGIQWAAIERKLNPRRDDANNLANGDQNIAFTILKDIPYLAGKSIGGSIGFHGELSSSSLALMDNAREACASIKKEAQYFNLGSCSKN